MSVGAAIDQEAVREYVALVCRKRALDEELSSVKSQIAALDHHIADMLLDAGVELERVDLDGERWTVSTEVRIFPRPKFGDMAALCERFKEYIPGMVHETVNLQTLGAWTREQLKGNGLPEWAAEVVDYSSSPTTAVRRGRS